VFIILCGNWFKKKTKYLTIHFLYVCKIMMRLNVIPLQLLHVLKKLCSNLQTVLRLFCCLWFHGIYCYLLQIFTQGCIPSLKSYVESNLYTIGGIAIGVALVQLLGKQTFSSNKTILLFFFRNIMEIISHYLLLFNM